LIRQIQARGGPPKGTEATFRGIVAQVSEAERLDRLGIAPALVWGATAAGTAILAWLGWAVSETVVKESKGTIEQMGKAARAVVWIAAAALLWPKVRQVIR